MAVNLPEWPGEDPFWPGDSGDRSLSPPLDAASSSSSSSSSARGRAAPHVEKKEEEENSVADGSGYIMAAVSVAAMLERIEKDLVGLFSTQATKCFLDAMATVPGAIHRPLSRPVSTDIVQRVIHEIASAVIPEAGARNAAVNRIFVWIANVRRLTAACRMGHGDTTCTGLIDTFLWTFRDEIAKCVLFAEHVILMPQVVRILGKRTLEVAVLKTLMIEREALFAEMDSASESRRV
jgi:hypothetical protein